MSGLKAKSKKANTKETKKPLFSVVIPSYNQGNFIGSAINSFFIQKYDQKELIIVDNMSTDNSVSILKKNIKKARIVREKDKGQTNAINKGLNLSKGDILAYLNSDDVYDNDTFKAVYDYFVNNPNTKIVYGIGNFINEHGGLIGYYKSKSPTLNNLFSECVISQPTVFMKREVYEKIGEFDESLNYAMDYDYWIRVAKIYKFGFINKLLASTRIHSQTKTFKEQKNVFNEVLISQKKNYGTVSDVGIFNYAYAVAASQTKRNNFIQILIFIVIATWNATERYLKYGKIPGIEGLKHYIYLFRSVFVNNEK